MNDLNNVLSFLQSKNIKMTINNEWFRDCCQFYVSSNPRGSADELRNFVYDQWLLADLSELGERCLPSHIPTSPNCKLDGRYAVQVNEMINIGESGYSQLKQIRCRDTISTFCESEEKVPSWQPKRNRTLRLSLTDGALNLIAMEFESIPALREPFIPGLKILLMGPIECRRGVLLLTPKNIEILGGEVDSLLICNATENVLARNLNFEENPNPLGQIASSQAADNEETESDAELDLYLQDFENSLEPTRGQNNVPVSEDRPGTNPRDLTNPSLNHRNQSNTTPMSRNREAVNHGTVIPVPDNHRLNRDSPDFGNLAVGRSDRENIIGTSSYNHRDQDHYTFVDDERRLSVDTHSRIDDSGNFSTDARNRSSNIPSANESRTLDMHSRLSKCSNWLQSTTSVANAGRKDRSPIIGVVTPIPSNKRNAESPPHRLDTKSPKIDVLVPSHTMARETQQKDDTVSLQRLVGMLQRQSPCCVECLLRVTKLIQKPRIKNDKWLVITEVADETGQLNVTFDDEFLQENIFMISACEVKSLRDKIASNPAVKDRVDELIRGGIVRILLLRGLFNVRIIPGNELAEVVNVNPVGTVHAQ